MAYNISKNLIDSDFINQTLSLYEEYKQELIEVTQEADKYRVGKTIMLPYRTVEMLYLYVRSKKPESIVEFSPHDGWSTFWMLKALEKNKKGIIHSFDLIPNCSINLKRYIDNGCLKFHQGDVKHNLTNEIIKNTNFFYIDTEHTSEMALWYDEKIFKQKQNTNSFFGVDDVLHKTFFPENTESQYVIEFINKNKVKFASFDFYEFQSNYYELCKNSKELRQGHDGSCSGNLTTLFFHL